MWPALSTRWSPDCHPSAGSRARARISRSARFYTPRRFGGLRPLLSVPSEHVPSRIERQRVRRLVSAAEAARGFPFEGLVLADDNGPTAVSRDRLAEHVAGCEAAQMEAFELALALAAEAALTALRAREGWVNRVRAGLVALLEFFDEEPALARYLVVGSAQAGPAVLARRGEALERLTTLLDDERAPARAYPPPLTAHAVASGVLGVLCARLSEPEPGVLAELAGSLMSFVVLPFLGARAARRELRRADGTVLPSPVSGGEVDLLQDPGRRLNHHREVEVLRVLAGEPGLNNTQVALRAGIKDQGHVSRLLARLARLGLIENVPDPGRRPGVKAWRLTVSGEQLHTAACREACTPGPGVVLGLPEELAGRLDFWAVCMLRAVGEQPWLTSREVASRAGVEDPAQMRGLLGRLSELGLVASVREAHLRGTPKVWRLTDRGRELAQTIELEMPAPARSMALDLMCQTGGRLSEPAIAVLRASAAEPGLSNGEIAQQVGIIDANSMSQLLARLSRRGLIENARNGGRENVWALTPTGHKLERAIRQETSTPLARRVAFDVLKDRGGRLNHRVVAVLHAIAAEPGLSNTEISKRVGFESKGHASTVLTRLSRFGLIENQVLDAAPFEANAWRLTAGGRQLEAAIRHEGRFAVRRTSRNGQATNPAGVRMTNKRASSVESPR
jgi:DNA-binding MarR family transcriptional regulator